MLKALLVDDDINVIKCLLKMVNWDALGYKVVAQAYDGKQAFELAKIHKPEVVISDIKMPYMDGTELCRAIREEIGNVEIIFLSAFEDFQTARMALKYGVREYILKPIDINKIKMLSDILSEININAKSISDCERILSDKKSDEEIMENLKKCNLVYFDKLFDSLNKGSDMNNYMMIRAICIKLVNLLYEYLAAIGVSEDIISKKKNAVENDFKELSMVKDCIFYTVALYHDLLQFEEENKNSYYIKLIDDIKKLVKENYGNENFNVSAIAGEFHFSIDYIGKLFKNYTGIVLSNYIADMRLQKAENLLRDTALSVNDIALMVGYSNSSYFTKVFKSKMQMTPSEYRAKISSIQSNF